MAKENFASIFRRDLAHSRLLRLLGTNLQSPRWVYHYFECGCTVGSYATYLRAVPNAEYLIILTLFRRADTLGKIFEARGKVLPSRRVRYVSLDLGNGPPYSLPVISRGHLLAETDREGLYGLDGSLSVREKRWQASAQAYRL